MARYIDADKIITDAIKERKFVLQKEDLIKSQEVVVRTVYKDLAEFIYSQPTADVVGIPEGGIGNLSDGYHTFNELYHHRAILFSVICNIFPDKAWKSKLHDTGDMFDGMFIVGIETPNGQATYHYDIEPYWDMFKVKELERAPKWDGHTPTDAIERIRTLSKEVKHGHWIVAEECKTPLSHGYIRTEKTYICPFCHYHFRKKMKHCGECGAEMDGKDNNVPTK